MCGIFLSRFPLFRFCLSWIYLSWIFPFRWNAWFFGSYRLFVDRIFNVSELAVFIAEALSGEVPVPFQLFQGGSDGIHAVLADMGKPLGGIIQSSGRDSMSERSPFAFKDSSVLRRWWLLITVKSFVFSTRNTAISKPPFFTHSVTRARSLRS